MKKTKSILFFGMIFLMISCQQDEPMKQGSVQFSFNNISAGNKGGRKQTDQIPDGASLILSITKSNGDSVFTWKKIELLKVGDQFITDPLPLMPGGYIITDFMIRGADSTLLYIAPKQGSPLASLVTKTIPMSFNVGTNTIENVSVDVVDVNHKSPEDFGYASFPIHVIPNSGFPVSAFVVSENGQTNITAARAYVLHNGDSILTQTLWATINNVNWVRGADSRFSLVIIKDGYARYEKEFDLDSMMTALDGKPLAVVLKPAYTITWTPYSADSQIISFHIVGDIGSKIRIDWGDGTVENHVFNDEAEVHHTYHEPVKHFFSATGDLNAIHEVGFYYSMAKVDTLSLAHLPELNYFALSFFGQYFGKGIDFSHNPKLQSVDFSYLLSTFTTLDFSKNPMLTGIDLQFANRLSSSVVDKVIDDVFASALLHNTRNGRLNLIARDYRSPEMIGPPSPEQINKLNSLVNDLGWQVYPLVLPH